MLPQATASSRLILLTLALAAAVSGCSQPGPPEMTFPPPAVTVSYPLERDVTDYNDFTGRTLAVETVRIRARVWGYLQKINFREGAEVQKGDVLFEIDPRSYQADLDRAEATLVQNRARRDRLQSDYERGRRMLTQRAIGQEEYDKIVGDRAEAEAAVRLAEAGLAAARLNLDFTKVRAPVSGHIGRALVTIGNLIQSGEMGGTTLTTLVSVDPVYVYFDVDDLTFMEVNRLSRTGPAQSSESRPRVLLGLACEQGYPREGVIDFIDNQVDASTGTLKMRGLFRNPDRALTPGLFARVRVPLGGSRRSLLVTDRAVDTDQGQKVVYVVNADDSVEKRSVRLGRLHDGMREIESGVKAGERVVVDGLQRVRGGIKVEPKLVAMPVPAEARPAAPVEALKATADASRTPKS